MAMVVLASIVAFAITNVDGVDTNAAINVEALTLQYTEHPYPARGVRQWNEMSNTCLPSLSYYLFEGKYDVVWRKPSLRVLDAGGGTGDTTLTLAQQFVEVNPNVEIVHLDLSPASQRRCRERAEFFGLSHMITFIQGSLLDLDASTHGKFDLITCNGVLMVLANPIDGLQALKRVLKPDGGLSIMVYGEYGRTGVYDVQKMIRMLSRSKRGSGPRSGKSGHHKTNIMHNEFETLHDLLGSLPQSNRLKRNKPLWQGVQNEVSTPSGAYDLFLIHTDRAYTVPELYEWVEGKCGLHLNALVQRGLYDPFLYLKNATSELIQLVEALGGAEQQSMAELLHGAGMRHSFYASMGKRVAPKVTANSIPCLLDGFHEGVWALGEAVEGEKSATYGPTVEVFRNIGRYSSNFQSDQQARYVVSILIQFPWIHGNCRDSFAKIHAENIGETRMHGMPLTLYLLAMSDIMKMMIDWGDSVILVDPLAEPMVSFQKRMHDKRQTKLMNDLG